MAKQRVQKYDGLTTSELAKITRERGLDKPQVLNAGEWAAWLRDQDNAQPTAPQLEAKPEAAPASDLDLSAEESSSTTPKDDDIQGDDGETERLDTPLSYEQLTGLSVSELRDYAENRDIDLSGLSKKADIIHAIVASQG